MVATGEIGRRPKIVLWDAYTGVTIRVIKFHTKGVSNLAFSPNGNLLVSVGMDNDRLISVSACYFDCDCVCVCVIPSYHAILS